MYHYAEGNVTRGPVPIEELRGRIGPSTLVWREGMAEWALASEVAELSDVLGATVSPADDVLPVLAPPASPAVMSYADPRLAKTTPGLAVAAMVLGIVSVPLLCLWFISLPCAILALIFGLISRSQCIREERPGRGMAIAGIVLGCVPFLLIIIFLAIVVVPLLLSSSSRV